MKERQGRGASLSCAGKRRRGRRRVLGDAGEASTREVELGRRGKGEAPLLPMLVSEGEVELGRRGKEEAPFLPPLVSEGEAGG